MGTNVNFYLHLEKFLLSETPAGEIKRVIWLVTVYTCFFLVSSYGLIFVNKIIFLKKNFFRSSEQIEIRVSAVNHALLKLIISFLD